MKTLGAFRHSEIIKMLGKKQEHLC